jgi:hypothetical protein
MITQRKVLFNAQTLVVATVTADFEITNCVVVGFQLTLTGGSPVGNAVVQGSNDGVNWTNLATAQTISAAGSFFWTYGDLGYALTRLSVTLSSGTTVATATAIGKGY